MTTLSKVGVAKVPRFGGCILIDYNMNGDVIAWWMDNDHKIDDHYAKVGYGLRPYKSQAPLLKAIVRVAKRECLQFSVRLMNGSDIIIDPDCEPIKRPYYKE